MLQPYSGFLEGGGVIEVEHYNCSLSVAEVVVDDSTIPFMSGGIPQFQGVALALVGHSTQQDVNADGGLWLLALGVVASVFEDE